MVKWKMDWFGLCAGAQLGGAPPSAFHTLAKYMSPNKGATHFTLGLRPCFISSFLLQIYLHPLLKIPSCFPDYVPIRKYVFVGI